MKTPRMYTQKQMDQIQQFICETFGGAEDGMIAHEITSEYVHTDTQVIAPEGDNRVFVTFGMGAREMNAPHPRLRHAELLMCASEALDPRSKEGMTLIAELVALTKYPFRENTWLGHGHTIGASAAFRETFGFDAFALICVEDTEIDGIGEVDFLLAIPIYAAERKWIMETDTFKGYMILENIFGEAVYYPDSRREPHIPDRKTLDDLRAALDWERENC